MHWHVAGKMPGATVARGLQTFLLPNLRRTDTSRLGRVHYHFRTTAAATVDG